MTEGIDQTRAYKVLLNNAGRETNLVPTSPQKTTRKSWMLLNDTSDEFSREDHIY